MGKTNEKINPDQIQTGVNKLAEIEEQRNPSASSIRYADYILNHYSKDSMMDKICLARDLEKHGFKK